MRPDGAEQGGEAARCGRGKGEKATKFAPFVRKRRGPLVREAKALN
jgi:hypothetical protein